MINMVGLSISDVRTSWKYGIIRLMGHNGRQFDSTGAIQFFSPNLLMHRSVGYMTGRIPFDFIGPYLYPYAK